MDLVLAEAAYGQCGGRRDGLAPLGGAEHEAVAGWRRQRRQRVKRALPLPADDRAERDPGRPEEVLHVGGRAGAARPGDRHRHAGRGAAGPLRHAAARAQEHVELQPPGPVRASDHPPGRAGRAAPCADPLRPPGHATGSRDRPVGALGRDQRPEVRRRVVEAAEVRSFDGHAGVGRRQARHEGERGETEVRGPPRSSRRLPVEGQAQPRQPLGDQINRELKVDRVPRRDAERDAARSL